MRCHLMKRIDFLPNFSCKKSDLPNYLKTIIYKYAFGSVITIPTLSVINLVYLENVHNNRILM